MNTHELPMILFTVIAQMCVGSFLVLGAVQLYAHAVHADERDTEALIDPALYAIGPAMILGLAVSMLHMNDITHTFNVIRHVSTSWLSREIVFGSAFAGLGFVFAVLQFKHWGSAVLRTIVALITAVVGIGLVVSMSMIYYSLKAVPAWHTWMTPVQFFATTVLLGALAMGAAFVTTTMVRVKRDKPQSERVTELMANALRGIAVVAAVAAGTILIALPVHVSGLSAAGRVGIKSAAVFSGVWFVIRLVLLVVGACLLGILVFRYASSTLAKRDPRPLATAATIAFVLVLAGELLGRAQFYESMFRVGM